jgi:D-glycero-alpha-D-manno-heptose-7-phosphate kinase
MIITRSPIRLPFGGAGTDLASFYRDHEGFLIAAAIDKYVYITKHRRYSAPDRPRGIEGDAHHRSEY